MSKQLAQGCYQWNSGATWGSNRGPRVRIPSALTTEPLSHKPRRTRSTNADSVKIRFRFLLRSKLTLYSSGCALFCTVLG